MPTVACHVQAPRPGQSRTHRAGSPTAAWAKLTAHRTPKEHEPAHITRALIRVGTTAPCSVSARLRCPNNRAGGLWARGPRTSAVGQRSSRRGDHGMGWLRLSSRWPPVGSFWSPPTQDCLVVTCVPEGVSRKVRGVMRSEVPGQGARSVVHSVDRRGDTGNPSWCGCTCGRPCRSRCRGRCLRSSRPSPGVLPHTQRMGHPPDGRCARTPAMPCNQVPRAWRRGAG
jgi:hypothetical protein